MSAGGISLGVDSSEEMVVKAALDRRGTAVSPGCSNADPDHY
jgi:hypothetical protein